MNLSPRHASRFTHHVSGSRRHQAGSAVIIVMALLAFILVYVAANLRTINSLGRELKVLELQQIHRLQHPAPKINSPPAAAVTTNAVPTSPSP